MVKIKKKILIVLSIVVLAFGIIYRPVQADSGWDSDYDSGGSSWSSGSDWSSGSSWSSGSDWDYDSGGYSSGDGLFLMVISIVIIVFIIRTVLMTQKTKNRQEMLQDILQDISNNSNSSTDDYQDIDIEKIKEIDSTLNIEEFKQKAFEIYRDIQTAWMNFDTDTIRTLTTDELYNMYSSQLETLKLKKQKNIMENIEYIDAKITNITKENDVIKVSTYLNVRCHDYVVKEDTNEVVRGRKNAKINIKYMLTFVKSSSNNKIVEKCPNCGAPVDIKSSAVCEYCDSTLVKVSGEYVLSKKVSLGQNLER